MTPLEMANHGQRRTDGPGVPYRVEGLLRRALAEVESDGLRAETGEAHPLLPFIIAAFQAGTESRRLADERRTREDSANG